MIFIYSVYFSFFVFYYKKQVNVIFSPQTATEKHTNNAKYISLNSDKYFKYKYNFTFVETFRTVILRKITYSPKYFNRMSVAICSSKKKKTPCRNKYNSKRWLKKPEPSITINLQGIFFFFWKFTRCFIFSSHPTSCSACAALCYC